MSLDWLKHLYGFSSGMYFAIAIILLLYGLPYRKRHSWKISIAFLLLAISYTSYAFFNIFFQQIFTDVTQSLYSASFLKFCAMFTPVSVLILTYVYIEGFRLRSVQAYEHVRKERWIVYIIYLSTFANIIAIYFIDDPKLIAKLLLLGFVLPCFGATRLAMVANEKSTTTIGYGLLFGGLLVLILTGGFYSIENNDISTQTEQAITNVAFAILTCFAGFFTIRYGYDEVKSFFLLKELDKRNIIGDITTGINNNEFKLHYQPQLDLQSGNVTAAEALIRWEHAKKGRISPLDYIPLAEKSGLISHITMWVISTAIKEAKQLQTSGYQLKISINFSPKDITNHVIDHLEKTLKEYSYPSKLVVVEITESQMIQSDDETFSLAMKRLHNLGVSISIDDYGTGFSSLSHMQKLKIHELKIDQSFITDLSYESNEYAIVYSTLQMARNLKLISVAEGVEDAETLNLLKELNCDLAQGYGIAKPMPYDDLVTWLSKNQRPNYREPPKETDSLKHPSDHIGLVLS